MLRKFNSIGTEGLFSKHRWGAGVPDLESISIIYGPNGSGKTSLARALFDAANDPKAREFLEIFVDTAGGVGRAAEEDGLYDRLYVFSDSYVRLNHKLTENEATLPAIITLGKRTVDAEDEIAEIRAELPGLEGAATDAISSKQKAAKAFKVIAERVSGLVVDDLTKLGGEYQSRSKFSVARVAKAYAEDRTSWRILTSEELQADKETIVATASELIKEIPGDLIEVSADVVSLSEKSLKSSPVSILIDSIAQRPDAEEWVRHGLGVHGTADDACLFCGGELTQQRKEKLNAHFSKESEEVSRVCLDVVAQLLNVQSNLTRVSTAWPSRGQLSSRHRSAFDGLVSDFATASGELNVWCDALSDRLKKKAKSPAVNIDTQRVPPPPTVDYSGLNSLVRQHNLDTEQHTKLQADAGHRIRNHHLLSNDEEYATTSQGVDDAEAAVKITAQQVIDHNERLAELQNVEGDISPSAQLLTAEVSRLLGRAELSFHAAGPDRYEVRRGAAPAHGLSEGERTAVTLVHFLETVRRHDPSRGAPIIVVDDPVSSLDQGIFIGVSSALWGLIASSQSKVEQIVLLTHNFELFRQWDIQWDRYPAKKTSRRPDGRTFKSFELKPKFKDGVRTGSIALWPSEDLYKIKKKMRSVYHHGFIALADAHVNLREVDSLDSKLEAQLLFPNVIRRVLESFLAFKLPEQVGDLSQLMSKSADLITVNDKVTDPDALRHDLLRFSNVYSHDESPQTDSMITPEEIVPAIGSLFLFMDAVDRQHFVGMCKVLEIEPEDLLVEQFPKQE